MAQDRPTAPELLRAVREWLESELLPEAGGARGFYLRVAINVLGIVERELLLGPSCDAEEQARLRALLGHEGSLAELSRELCQRIRDGRIAWNDPALLAHAKATTKDKLRVANPGYKE